MRTSQQSIGVDCFNLQPIVNPFYFCLPFVSVFFFTRMRQRKWAKKLAKNKIKKKYRITSIEILFCRNTFLYTPLSFSNKLYAFRVHNADRSMISGIHNRIQLAIFSSRFYKMYSDIYVSFTVFFFSFVFAEMCPLQNVRQYYFLLFHAIARTCDDIFIIRIKNNTHNFSHFECVSTQKESNQWFLCWKLTFFNFLLK